MLKSIIKFKNLDIFKKIFILVIIFTILIFETYAQENEYKIENNLEDGTTIIKTYSENMKIIQEDIILKSGRHKTTYYTQNERPHYGIVKTGTGSFGFMYYTQAKAPLFKFWDYGRNNREIQFYSNDFKLIAKIKIEEVESRRGFIWVDWSLKKIFTQIILILLCIFIGILVGIFISKRRIR